MQTSCNGFTNNVRKKEGTKVGTGRGDYKKKVSVILSRLKKIFVPMKLQWVCPSSQDWFSHDAW